MTVKLYIFLAYRYTYMHADARGDVYTKKSGECGRSD